jgi:hypothetical protein
MGFPAISHTFGERFAWLLTATLRIRILDEACHPSIPGKSQAQQHCLEGQIETLSWLCQSPTVLILVAQSGELIFRPQRSSIAVVDNLAC